jgi:sugar phosphate permease
LTGAVGAAEDVAPRLRLLLFSCPIKAPDFMPSGRWLRILPVAFIMYTIAFIDRTNISLALPSMSRELGMSPTQAGDAAGVFFWGYLLLQVPGGYLAERWSAKLFVSALLMVWGIGAIGCGLVRSWGELRAMRFVLGVAEGGVWPATVVLLSHWFPRAERARANAYWMLCLPVAVVVSSPLSGWILGRWDWRVLLITEGGLPILWLVVWWWFIEDHPHQARWISPAERDFLVRTLADESAELDRVAPEPYLRALLRPQVLLLIAIYFCLAGGLYGYLFWLPTALEGAKAMTNFQAGILSALPYVVTIVGMVVLSQHSDRMGERRGHVAAGLAWAGLFLLGSVIVSRSAPLTAFFLITLVGAGCYGALGPFWAIPTETLPRSISGSASGLITGLGNLGGYFGPLLVGKLNQRTGNFIYGFALLSAGWFAGSILTILISPRAVVLSDKERP